MIEFFANAKYEMIFIVLMMKIGLLTWYDYKKLHYERVERYLGFSLRKRYMSS